MYVAPPPLNYWQCVVQVQQNVLTSQSPSQILAQNQILRACRLNFYCNPRNITCQFNGMATQTQTCWVGDEIGQRWMAQNSYQPCQSAMLICQRVHLATQRYNFHCFILN